MLASPQSHQPALPRKLTEILAIAAQGRTVTSGRLWEGFGSDPYLSGVLGAETILGGLDSGVQSSVKHYLANEQESFRAPYAPGSKVQAVSSNVDEKTLHEVYLW